MLKSLPLLWEIALKVNEGPFFSLFAVHDFLFFSKISLKFSNQGPSETGNGRSIKVPIFLLAGVKTYLACLTRLPASRLSRWNFV